MVIGVCRGLFHISRFFLKWCLRIRRLLIRLSLAYRILPSVLRPTASCRRFVVGGYAYANSIDNSLQANLIYAIYALQSGRPPSPAFTVIFVVIVSLVAAEICSWLRSTSSRRSGVCRARTSTRCGAAAKRSSTFGRWRLGRFSSDLCRRRRSGRR